MVRPTGSGTSFATVPSRNTMLKRLHFRPLSENSYENDELPSLDLAPPLANQTGNDKNNPVFLAVDFVYVEGTPDVDAPQQVGYALFDTLEIAARVQNHRQENRVSKKHLQSQSGSKTHRHGKKRSQKHSNGMSANQILLPAKPPGSRGHRWFQYIEAHSIVSKSKLPDSQSAEFSVFEELKWYNGPDIRNVLKIMFDKARRLKRKPGEPDRTVIVLTWDSQDEATLEYFSTPLDWSKTISKIWDVGNLEVVRRLATLMYDCAGRILTLKDALISLKLPYIDQLETGVNNCAFIIRIFLACALLTRTDYRHLFGGGDYDLLQHIPTTETQMARYRQTYQKNQEKFENAVGEIRANMRKALQLAEKQYGKAQEQYDKAQEQYDRAKEHFDRATKQIDRATKRVEESKKQINDDTRKRNMHERNVEGLARSMSQMCTHIRF